MKLLLSLLFCLGIGLLIRYLLNKIPNDTTPKKKKIEIKLNEAFLENNKTEVENLKLPAYMYQIYEGNADKELPFGGWHKPATFSYMTDEELQDYKIPDRIVPFIEDYMVFAFDKERNSFLQFHVEDTKPYNEYPKQNWQQFLTTIFYNWYWNLYLLDEDFDELVKFKKVSNLLEYKHLDSFLKLLSDNHETTYLEIEKKIETFKTTMN
ncbi:protein of unknown function [Tenacibaculum sp. 190130A14a]|uniref:Uncharacterized protein n=1 Tax=Tenacibaculum polynesiense TaxID=3137857 RepID=A0ABM9PFK5_9FLAO